MNYDSEEKTGMNFALKETNPSAAVLDFEK
jgi:hypothetical protein